MRYIGLCSVLLLLQTGCSKTETTPSSDNERIIGFTTDVTRTAKENFEAGDAFSVWGWYTPEDAFSQVFDATKVSTADGSKWSYENLRFWHPNKTYAFHALYPSIDILPGTASYTADGELSITGFDASKQIDLMSASVTAMSGNSPAPVNFLFTHLLSRVQIVGKCSESSAGIEGFTPRVHAIRLYGMPKTGNLSINSTEVTNKAVLLSAWQGTDATTSDSPLAVFSSETGKDVPTEGILLLDVLLLPQHITQNYYIEVEYSTDGTGGDRESTTIALSSLPVTLWNAGQQYRYTFRVSDNNRILFDTPTVNAWDEAIGGIIIID